METFRDEMHDLFSMFHDFDLIATEQGNKTLTLTIAIPWSLLWDEDEIYEVKLELYGCDYFYCDYQESVHSGPFKSKEDINLDTIDYSTKDIQTITSLKLSIQAYTFREPNHYIFYCNSGMQKINEGQIMITADRYMLFDKFGNSLTIDKMKELGTMWWDNIEKMWDSQKGMH
jgi:hypothetical protein